LQKDSPPVAYLDTQDAAKAVIESLKVKSYDKKTIALIGQKFWSSKDVITLCERLSGQTANITYIPSFAFVVLRVFFRFFQGTWNIADRLQFGELSKEKNINANSISEFDWSYERLNLENYLQEYFGKILKKLREANYQQTQKSNEISFL
jgi:hypothetical protein